MAKNKPENNLEQELAGCLEKSEEYLNNWKRAAADLINYKKDETKRLGEFAMFANESIILELIGLFDEVNLALGYAPDELKKDTKWSEGIGNLMKKFTELLGKHGVSKIETVENKFNPLEHEAIGQKTSDKEPGTILEEIQPGYTMNGKVIKPARVIIEK